MIGLFLGTSEGRTILEQLNKFTDNIYVSAATQYGGEVLKGYNYKHLNTTPLTQEEMEKVIVEQGIGLIVDATHPYATVVTENLLAAAKAKKVLFVRYERPSVVKHYLPHSDITVVDHYEDLKDKLAEVQGVIINTTGSNNVEKLQEMELPNPIIHKVLPTKEVLTKLYNLEIPLKNIVAICGGGSKGFNKALFLEYDAKAVILKDSGKQGKTKEKIEAALELGMKVFIINRDRRKYKNVFDNEEETVSFIRTRLKEGK